MMSARYLTIVALTAGLLTACADEEKTSLGACDRERCSSACRELAGPDCDVREPGCQRRIFEATQCVRGSEGELPTIRLITEDQYRAEHAEDAGSPEPLLADGGVPDGGLSADAGVDGGPSSSRATPYLRGLELLGLAHIDEADDELPELVNVAAYYSGEERRVTLLDRGEPQDSVSAQTTLAHELVHSLQDQQLGLSDVRRSTGRSTDASLALGCLIEGEAVLYEELAWMLLNGWPVDIDYWDRDLEWQIKFARDRVPSSPSAYENLWLLRYGIGARFLLDAWLDGGNAAVRRLFDTPPTSSVYWMLGYAESQTRIEPLSLGLACTTPRAPSGFTPSHWDTLGAFSLYAILSRSADRSEPVPNSQAFQLARSWRQDHLQIFESEADEVAVSWRVRFSDAEAAKEVARLLSASMRSDLKVVRHGDELEVYGTDRPSGVIKGFRGTDPDDCPLPK